MDKQANELVANGRALESLIVQPGWEAIQKMLAQWEHEHVEALLNYRGGDLSYLQHAQIAVRSVRALRQRLDMEIKETIDGAKNALIEYAERENLL